MRQIEVEIQRIRPVIVILDQHDRRYFYINIKKALALLDLDASIIHERADWDAGGFDAADRGTFLEPRQQ
jgi:hypothetical protein